MKNIKRYFWWMAAMLTCGSAATMIYEHIALSRGGLLGHVFGFLCYLWVFYELKTGKVWGNDKLTEDND